ncbi:uncharacterized protein PgNI_05071 [Pyricularia grisea]|uniref:Uncharacterized protein n=1 Tax=Pyricularia grisea TaxID=148305 RepID=A0A6P8BBD9_PYRGI|nr:uncharacterized protein PgNI_05071 [Pyricularia grisea]TLD13119.1 hypothetical protein PgNI_05071 [Pyricularia grisea]
MQILSTMLIAAAGVMSAAVDHSVVAKVTLQSRADGQPMSFSNVIINSAAYTVFLSSDIRYPAGTQPSSNQKTATPNVSNNIAATSTQSDEDPNIVYVLQCTKAGFRDDCTVFGAPYGQCVSYWDFNSQGKEDISDRFNDKVTALSTNTGGVCQFYRDTGCDESGNDRGFSTSYNTNLAVATPEDSRTVLYEKKISSWRC